MNFLTLTLIILSCMEQQPPNRKLLLFGRDQAAYQQQINLLSKDSAAMRERNLVMITLESTEDYHRHNVTPGTFTLLLIGRDGGEKLRSVKPVDPREIFGLIDSMPMRKQEMNKNKN